MNTYPQSNMYSAVYKTPDNIKNIKIRIKLRKMRSANSSSAQEVMDLKDLEFETKEVSWQQKIFNKSEMNFYSKENNCITDQEKQYNRIITNSSESCGRIFTYIQDDEFCSTEENIITDENDQTYLQKHMNNLKLLDTPNNSKVTKFNLTEILENCIQNPFVVSCYKVMYIMADLGNSDNDNLGLKCEYIICCIKYNEENKTLLIYPDFSKDLNVPYTIETGLDGKTIYEYFIELASNNPNKKTQDRRNLILQKLSRRNLEMKNQFIGTEFSMPPKNVTRVYLFFEILSANNFENDIYIQYNLELPDSWICKDVNTLQGTTQSCQTRHAEDTAHFGTCFEICIENNSQECGNTGFPAFPCIYFQVISQDEWDRYRTEGIAYKTVPIGEPGTHEFHLNCVRVCPKGIAGNLKRFFIGDYSNIDDISWLGLPKYYEDRVLNKYGVHTAAYGSIQIRVNILNQSRASMHSHQMAGGDSLGHRSLLDSSPAHSLVKSVEDVVIAFKRAQERMQRARKNVLKEN